MPPKSIPSRRSDASVRTKNVVRAGSCVDVLSAASKGGPGWTDLIFADPPFNLGKPYDVYKDSLTRAEYLGFTKLWMTACLSALSPRGTMWVAIGDEYVHRFRVILEDDLEMHCKSHVVWHYTFGVNQPKGFSRSHTHLLHYVRDRKDFAWNGPEIKVPSWRLKNGDKRADPDGRLPDDTWQYSRICGTFKEREGWHPCQMPESVMARIVRVSSSPGDMVVDPFLGSGTTGAVAKKLGRNFLGVELSDAYAEAAKARIAAVKKGDPIPGEPAGVDRVRTPSRGRRVAQD